MSIAATHATRTNANASAARAAANVSRLKASRSESGARKGGGGTRMGNQATQAILLDHFVQAKLSVSAPGDALEREADRVAESIVSGGNQPMQRACAKCEHGLARKGAGDAAPELPGDVERSVLALEGHGSALPAPLRASFEDRMGHGFADVRIHTSPAAARTASTIGALAYTHGRNIVFAPGQYQPTTSDGDKLLAHELAHVVQQRPAAAAGPEVADRVQRLCGPTEIGAPTGCTSLTSEPIGELVKFKPDCNEFLSNAEVLKVKNFADSMLETDRVRVHGFASMDGNAGYNHKLSCARAQEVVAELMVDGIAESHIDIFEHGPVPGPVEQRRSVVLELDSPVSRQPTPQLSANHVLGPNPGDCGDVEFVIQWAINRKSDRAKGGFVVQEITISRDDAKCSGAQIPWGHTSPLHYYEVWRVLPDSKDFDPLDGNQDQLKYKRPIPNCATGSATWSAVATYFDGVDTLPVDMMRWNPETTAFELYSSVYDPMLPGTPSRPVPHELSIEWDCCPCSTYPTVVLSSTPPRP